MGKKSSKKGGDKSHSPKTEQANKTFFSPAVTPSHLVQKATQTSGEPVQDELKQPLSEFLGENIDRVRIHSSSASQQAAESIHANAFTIGNQVHLGTGGLTLARKEKDNLLAHEIVHTVQQGSAEPQLQGSLQISQPHDAAETQARSIADSFTQTRPNTYRSFALGMRNSQRIGKISSPAVHRDIKGHSELPFGKMELDFTKHDAAAAGGSASEQGEARFHPNDSAPESDEIRLVQIVRVIDTTGISTTAGEPWEYGGAEADRNKVRTTANAANNVAGGFFIDHAAATANPRTAAADATVLPYYNAYWNGDTGKRRGTTKKAATLWDGPSHNQPVKYNFVTSAKANDTGVWYGTALWGFEIYMDAGKAKIKNEYKSFRQNRGATTDAALTAFNDFYKNPGTAGAP